MTNRMVSSHYSFVFLTIVLVFLTNVHRVLCYGDTNERPIQVTRLDRLHLPPYAVGPSSTAFDPHGDGPYTVVSNGKVLKWSNYYKGFLDFAVTSPCWSKYVCESKDTHLEPVCGRPLGLEFCDKKGTLYITDAYFKLRSVESNGGVSTLLASSAEGVPFNLTSGLDVDQETGHVYFTDASADFQIKDLDQAISSGDMSGRMMKYDPKTKKVTVLLRYLALPFGLALSKDGEFVLVSEFSKSRIIRYWVKGPKAYTSDIFFVFSKGAPSNIRRNKNGDFWVALSIGNLQTAIPFGILLDKNGYVLRTLDFSTAYVNVPISSVQEYSGELYVGSLLLDYVGVTKTTRG